MEGLGNPSPILPDGGGVTDAVLERIVEGLHGACDLAREEEVRLLVENVRSCWGNTGLNTARILQATNRPELAIIWDVANDFVSRRNELSGRLPRDEALHHRHALQKMPEFVDPAIGLTAWTAIGEGEVDVDGQVADLLRDGFDRASAPGNPLARRGAHERGVQQNSSPGSCAASNARASSYPKLREGYRANLPASASARGRFHASVT